MAISRSDIFFNELLNHMDPVLQELRKHTSSCGYPIYSSMDIRDSGWKVCAVDVNLFPAGFNLLSDDDQLRASIRMGQFLSAKLMTTSPWKITVIPESHTNNQGYLENLAGICTILRKAGAEVRVAWSGSPIPKPWTIKTLKGFDIEYLPVEQALDGADALVLNHDLSGGLPSFLEGNKLPVFPSPNLGWYKRRKSMHFEIVDALLKSLQRKFEFFDPWYFSAAAKTVTHINIENPDDRKKLFTEAKLLFSNLELEYKKRDVSEKPCLFLKNNAGTYGMGVLQIDTPEAILELNRSEQNKMRKGKESVPISEIILQEAIPTVFQYLKNPEDPNSNVAAEPVLYMIDGLPIGGFMRLHENLGPRAQWKNLNQPGGALEPLGSSLDPCQQRPFPKIRNTCPREELDGKYIYHFLAKLHATAAGLEECPVE